MFSYKEISKLSKEYPNDADFAGKIREMINNFETKEKELLENKEEQPYIYERNPDTGEIFRRRAGDYDNRECINPAVNSIPQL